MGDHQQTTARLTLRRWPRPARGFRLSPGRMSARRLRARLSTLLGLLGRYVRNLRLLTRGRAGAGNCSSPASAAAVAGKPGLGAKAVGNEHGSKAPRRPPCMRSNSFYARAVAECLEFIKGSNVPASPLVAPHATPRRGTRS
ncbi:hypothetical protein HU200_002921 [Digitaria exilis]|uniref:Uncharacterized protein n=1 Tax=Digitaria exilis TaxID=1010633 RepID=A0A835FXN0_9POAL|nr:hypothetical protein HU200_002921 [Digitaria exilis]